MGTDQMRLLSCVTYGSGDVMVRGFGPAVFTLLREQPNAAVHKAPAIGQPVTQEIMWRVKGGRAECSVNGTVVAGYDRSRACRRRQAAVDRWGVRHSFHA